MASQSRESYSFVGCVVECRGSGHDAAPRALFHESEQRCGFHCASHRLPAVVRHFLERRTIAVALRRVRLCVPKPDPY
jgi:hypothetical protein